MNKLQQGQYLAGEYDVIIIGGGHAGSEAAAAAARMGVRTLLLTMSPESIAMAPCNPAIGGPAKSVLVREIDALGGAMAAITDRTIHLKDGLIVGEDCKEQKEIAQDGEEA